MTIWADKLAYLSPLRRKSPALKTGFAVGCLCICVAARSVALSAIMLIFMGCLSVCRGGVSLSRYIKMLAVPLGFVLLSTIAIVIHFSTVPLDLWNLPCFRGYLTVSRASLRAGAALILTAISSVSCLFFLAFTTPVTDLLRVLRRLRCPEILLELMLLIYRNIFLLLEMGSSMLTAQKCRLGHNGAARSISDMGKMLAALLARALTRASEQYNAMQSRLYDGKIQVLSETAKARPAEIIGTMALLGLLAAGAAFCHGKGI